MANIITLKTDTQGNHLHAEVISDGVQEVTVVELHINGECIHSKEYAFCEILPQIIKDINHEIDKIL